MLKKIIFGIIVIALYDYPMYVLIALTIL